jgi:hypothetical protein
MTLVAKISGKKAREKRAEKISGRKRDQVSVEFSMLSTEKIHHTRD